MLNYSVAELRVITFYFVGFDILVVFPAKRCEVSFSGIVHIRITAAKVQYFFEKR